MFVALHIVLVHTGASVASQAQQQHIRYLPLAGYRTRLRRAGWMAKSEFWASKTIAGREALLLIDRTVARRRRLVRCTFMWLSTVRALETAYKRRSEAIRRRARFEIIDAAGRRPARTGLPEDSIGVLLYDLSEEA